MSIHSNTKSCFVDNHSYRAIGKTYLMELVETARSARNEDRSVQSLTGFIERGESTGGEREKKQKKPKKKKSSLTGNAVGDADMGGAAVAEQDKEPLSEAREASEVCAPSKNLLDPTAVVSLEKTKLKKLKRKSKQSDRESLKSAHENNLQGTIDVASGSKAIVGREDIIEAEEKRPTSLENLEDKQEPLSYTNPLTSELMAKEAELHELLESEVLLVETKGKEMSALLSSVDELEDEKHNVDKKSCRN